MGILAAIGVLLPFPFYYYLWTNPQAWVSLCGRSRDPSKLMAQVSHFLKLLQFISLYSVSSSLSWPPLYFWPLFVFGQFLNFRGIPIAWRSWDILWCALWEEHPLGD
ncbi:Phosphatidyl-N-methylethanolamine N-methyltransferase [Linum perenne]